MRRGTAEMAAMTSEPADAPRPARWRPRLTVRGLLVLIAAFGLAMGLGRFWLANRDPERALISRQLRTLADREAPAVLRRAAIDTVTLARGRQARRALKVLTATLDDPDAALRADTSRAIGTIGVRLLADSPRTSAPLVRPAADALLATLDDPDPSVRQAALGAFSRLHGTAGAMRATVVDPRTALPALLTLVGTELPTIVSPAYVEIGGGQRAWSPAFLAQGQDFQRAWNHAWAAQNQARWFMSVDPDALEQCYLLAMDCEDDRTRRGAILCLNIPIDGSTLPTTGGPGGTFSGIPAEVTTQFLVDRLRSNPAGDRRAILHALREIDYHAPIAPRYLAAIAAAADDADPKVRGGVASLLIRHRADAEAILPRLIDVARLELDSFEGLHITPVVLRIAPRSDAAAEVRSMLVEALGRSRDGRQRLQIGNALLVHAHREPGILDPLLLDLRQIADREAADEALAPVACDLMSRVAPGSSEVGALHSSLQEALERPMPAVRRSLIKAVLRTASGPPGPDAVLTSDPFDFQDE